MARLLCCLCRLLFYHSPGCRADKVIESLLNTSQVPGAIPCFISLTLGPILAKVGIINTLMKMKKLGSDGLKSTNHLETRKSRQPEGWNPELCLRHD